MCVHFRMSALHDVSHMMPFHRPTWAESWINGSPCVLFFVTPGTVITFGWSLVPRLISVPCTMIPELMFALIVTPGSRISVSPAGTLMVHPSVYVLPVSMTPLIEPQSGVESLIAPPGGGGALYT